MSTPDANLPPRPDANAPVPIAAPAPRSSSRPVILIVSIVATVAFVALALTVCVAAVDRMGQSAFDQFGQIDYCMKHPHDPVCKASFGPTP